MKRTEWFNRKFPLIEDNGLLPSIIERLAGTPARVGEMVRDAKPGRLQEKPGARWSVHEEIGHLGDLEPLWLQRLEELKKGVAELTPADLQNTATHNAGHNASAISALGSRFRVQREVFVALLRSLSEEQLLHAGLHPRLKTPMRAIDLAYFVAEHDDHHLAAMREILQPA